MTDDAMTQTAPWPAELAAIVAALQYRPGWSFELEQIDRGQGSEGLTFKVLSQGFDTYNPDRGQNYRVYHYFIVPAASYNRASWMRWVLDRLVDVETHECCEFMVVDGLRPFAPLHGPGNDPYYVRELSRVEDAETTFRGDRIEGSQGA